MKSNVEFKGVSADREPLIDNVSGSRAAMVGGHMKSAVPIDHPTPSPHFTGADTEYARFMFNDVVEDDGDVCSFNDRGRQRRAVFARHGKRGDPNVLQYAIFFRRKETGASTQHRVMIDLAMTNTYTHHDHIFTSELRATNKLRALVRGEESEIWRDDTLTEFNAIQDGELVDGVALPTVAISHPDIIEDSYTIAQSAADLMHGWGYREIMLSLREDEFLLDTYGQTINGERRPQYFPEIGQAIRDDGLVIAARRYDPLYAAIDTHLGETMHASPFFDHCEYVDADPEHYMRPSEFNGSRVIDLQVWRDESSVNNGQNNIRCTTENKKVLDLYAGALKDFYNDLVRFYFSINSENIIWSPKAAELLEKAFASETYEVYSDFQREMRREIDEAVKRGEYKRDQADSRILQRLKEPVQRSLKDPINTYTVRIVVRYPIPVTVSSKITDRSGTKGIVGRVLPDEQMPINELGQRVLVMRSQNAVVRRSTYSGLFHIYWSAASEQLKMRLKPMLEADQVDEAFTILLDYLARFNIDWANFMLETHETNEEKVALFKEIFDFTIRIWLPHELDTTPMDIVHNLGEFTPKKSKLLITNYDGVQEWTKNEFYVGHVETLRLDKTGREFSCISSMHLNYLGTIDASHAGRGGYPINFSAKKWMGESERRLLSGYGKLADEVHNRANSNEVHRAVVQAMYESDTPSNPGYLIDRKKFPLGESQVDKMIRNIHLCEGFELIRPVREDAE
ncbi:hypothetical protein pEaSNUABM11_00047 [Erwinia phage pEa_SNUABM_11]|nr:hypothetical protein pEaSNUABM11_00047 [Erwinia phage pEa_SNUABM_11]